MGAGAGGSDWLRSDRTNQGCHRAASTAVVYGIGHQPCISFRFTAQRNCIWLALWPCDHCVRHVCRTVLAVPEKKMDWRCGLALRLLHRPQRFHDRPLVFGFRVRNHLWRHRRDDGGTKFCGNGFSESRKWGSKCPTSYIKWQCLTLSGSINLTGYEKKFENLRYCNDRNSRFSGKEQPLARRGIHHLLRLRSGALTSD